MQIAEGKESQDNKCVSIFEDEFLSKLGKNYSCVHQFKLEGETKYYSSNIVKIEIVLGDQQQLEVPFEKLALKKGKLKVVYVDENRIFKNCKAPLEELLVDDFVHIDVLRDAEHNESSDGFELVYNENVKSCEISEITV